ncbi:MAG: AAA family ATPase, partial [Pseudomonadota bacterium]|nr:AAA family ATPase [Pseudomonadota bacterium]
PMDRGTYVYTKTGMARINEKLPFDVIFIDPTNYDASLIADSHGSYKIPKQPFPAEKSLARVRSVIGAKELRATGVIDQINDISGSGMGLSWVKQSSGMRRAQQIQRGINVYHAPNRLMMLLCDEPENSLHPSYLSIVSESLRDFSQQENCQVLLSTHSPQLVAENATDLTNILRVDKSDGSTRVHQYQNSAQDPVYNLTFLNNLDRAKMFFADRVILTEGETESAFFNYMIKNKMFGATPAAENVALANCQGKFYIQYYSKILTQYGIPHTTLWDLDRGKYPQHNEDILKCFNDYMSVGYCFYENIEAFSGTTKVPNLPAQINFIQKYDDGTIDASRRTELATLFNNLVRTPAAPEPVVADPNFKTVQAFQHVPTITAQPVALGLYKVMYKQKTK